MGSSSKAWPRPGARSSAASLAAAPAPPAALPPQRPRAWLRIFGVRCGLPCDPPLGGHSCNGGIIPRFHRAVCDLYGAMGVKAGVNSISLFDLTTTISSSRPNFPWPLPRSGRQGWPKAIAKRLALDGREHSGTLVGLGRPFPVKVSFRTCFLARFNVANYEDTEGSSPSGASIAPQTCIRSIREDRNHDAVMRIGGEAPRRRAHSKAR